LIELVPTSITARRTEIIPGQRYSHSPLRPK
jgi:hypothetical protein